MSQYFRFEIDSPQTKTQAAKSIVWTPDSEIVESADIELRKEGKRISTLTLTIYDPKQNGVRWPIANGLPDPAFIDIPVRAYLSKPSENQSASKLVFDGKMTSIQPAFPGPSNVSIVAHDRSVDLRRQALVRTFKNSTAQQIVTKILKEYGYTLDTSELTAIANFQRVIDIGISGSGTGVFSDWNQIVRALAVDGLELYVKGSKVKVRKAAQQTYPHTFGPDDGLVIEYKPTINHVGVPGHGGQSKSPVPAGNKGTQATAQGALKQETDAAKADATTHRTIPQGGSLTNNGAHTESPGKRDGQEYQSRRRKDQAELMVWACPDIQLTHDVKTQGWGAKFDRTWHLVSLRHSIAGRTPATSTMQLTSEPSDASHKQAGLPVLPGGNNH